MDTDLLLKCAIDTARNAGAHALKNSSRRDETIQVTQHDVKLKLDVECQEIAEACIRRAFPDHNILGEESDRTEVRSQESDYLWIVDPIDGTVNFSHGLSIWCVSVALQYQGSTVAAAVYAPALDELYTASTDHPAMMNDSEIHVSSIASVAQSMIFTGIDRHKVPGHEPYQTFQAIADNTQRPRIIGSAALDLCRVAAGQGDGYFESDIYIWDIAAAGFIIERAGGRAEVTKELGRPHQLQYLATNGIIHEEMKAVLGI
jgi:myo-inositol-1(or 4)-monophosphatase